MQEPAATDDQQYERTYQYDGFESILTFEVAFIGPNVFFKGGTKRGDGFRGYLGGFILCRRLTSMAETVIFATKTLRAQSKITAHFGRRSIPSGCVAEARNMLDILALPRLAGRAPRLPKL